MFNTRGTRRSTKSNKVYILAGPFTFKSYGKDQTSFWRLGGVFEYTRENGVTVLSIKLTLSFAVAELFAFSAKSDRDDGQVTE